MAPRMFADMNVEELTEARRRLVADADRRAFYDSSNPDDVINDMIAVRAIDVEIGRRREALPTRDDPMNEADQLRLWSTANGRLIKKLSDTEHEVGKLKAAIAFEQANVTVQRLRAETAERLLANQDTTVLQEDLRALLKALDMPDGRPIAPHAVFLDCLNEIHKRLNKDVT